MVFVISPLWSLLEDERGQDLIEYALLSATIGLAGFAVFNTLGGDDELRLYELEWRRAVRRASRKCPIR